MDLSTAGLILEEVEIYEIMHTAIKKSMRWIRKSKIIYMYFHLFFADDDGLQTSTIQDINCYSILNFRAS